MNYTEIAPPKELSSFVKCFWEYKSKDEDIQHTILPNGCFELVMVFEQQELTSVFLSGLRTRPYDVDVPKGVSVSAIRFMLLASEYIFNREISSILDSILLLNPNFWGLKELDSLPFSDRTIEIGKKLSGIIREKEIDQEKQLLLTTVLLKNRMKLIFNIYVAASYILFAFIQNIAVTERYGLSIVTVNVVMFLFVAYVWILETFQSKNDYSFSHFKWKYSWMIPLALFAYWCPLSPNGINLNPLHFFHINSATAFCLTTPLFLTIMTLNIPNINVVTYRITALIGVIIGLYNMVSFLNPHTVFLGILHIPLLTISLYCSILSYKIGRNKNNKTATVLSTDHT